MRSVAWNRFPIKKVADWFKPSAFWRLFNVWVVAKRSWELWDRTWCQKCLLNAVARGYCDCREWNGLIWWKSRENSFNPGKISRILANSLKTFTNPWKSEQTPWMYEQNGAQLALIWKIWRPKEHNFWRSLFLEFLRASLGEFGQKSFAPPKFACSYTSVLSYLLLGKCPCRSIEISSKYCKTVEGYIRQTLYVPYVF